MNRLHVIAFTATLALASTTAAQSPAGSCFFIDYNEFVIDATVRYLNCGFGPEMNTGNELTLEIWSRVYDTGWNQKLIGRTNGSFNSGYVTAVENGKCYSEIWNPGLNEMKEGFVLPQQYWVHFAVTFTAGGEMVTYVNGIREGSITVGGNPISTNSDPLIIGIAPWDLANFQSFGHIDEVRVWNLARSEAEINDWMYKPLTGLETGLIAYYDFNEGSGLSAADSGPFGFDGTIVNGSANNWRESRAPIASATTAATNDLAALWRGTGITDPRVASTDQGMSLLSDFAMEDNNYAVFGHDGMSGTTTDDIATDAPSNFARSTRQWSMTETDTIICDVIFDLENAAGGGTVLPTDKDPSFYTLLWRADASGDYLPVATGASLTGDIVSFDNVELANGWYAVGVGDAEYSTSTGIHQLLAGVSLMPNPAAESVLVEWENTGAAVIELYSIDGRLLLRQLVENSRYARLNLTGLPSGSHTLRLESGGSTWTGLLQVER